MTTKSWQTTVTGILTIVAGVVGFGLALFNHVSLDIAIPALVTAITTGAGLLRAKDANVSNSPNPGPPQKVS
jgi:hypothetical protein